MTILLKVKEIFIAICVLLASANYSYASHVSGGEVTYTSLGNNQYKVQLVIYSDCMAFDPGASALMLTENTCGLGNIQFNATRDTMYEVSQVCSGGHDSSFCKGGTLPGNIKNIYSAIITLPGVCSSWTFYHESCCRNISNNVPTQPSYTFYATLNNQDVPENNSPYFTSFALPNLCVGQSVCYSPGVIEIDGNILSYSLISAMDTDPNTPVTYSAGYSGTSPIPGITMDLNTGLISLTPTAIGNYVVCYEVTEKNAAGIVIGSVMRDIQMTVINCSNQLISCNSGPISNLTGNGAVSTGSNSFQVCENVPFSFTTSFTDPDASDILSYTSNILQILPGVSITSSGTNPMTISISWTAPPGSANWNTVFEITASDNACPFMGQQTVNYSIDILPSANAGTDQTRCGNMPVQLHANGPGNVYTWSVLNGPPIIVGTNFSCNPCQTPLVLPSSTTTYLLTCNGANSCMNTDTVTVFVAPDFSFDLNQNYTITCVNTPIQLTINNILPQATGYSYQWSPAIYLNDPSIANPTVTIPVGGTYMYVATVTSPNGCSKKDTLQIVINSPPVPVATSSSTNACAGSTVTLGVSFGNAGSGSCGISNSGTCNGAGNSIQVGSGTLTNTNSGSSGYPAPYGNYYTSAKHQFLFTAAELSAAGLVPGKIDEIDFNVMQINGTTTYHNYNIRMGCTNLTSFAGETIFQTGLYDVYPAQIHNVIMGWNSHVFNNIFEWDGNSNIIVEISFCEGPPDYSYTQNCLSSYTVTPFVSCMYIRNDAAPYAASWTTASATSSNRPNIKFHNCLATLTTSNFVYSWSPVNGIATPNSQTTNALISAGTTYTVTVADTATGCIASDSIQIDLCTGISETDPLEILIYPNPISDVLTIANSSHYILEYSVVEVTGKEVIPKNQSRNSSIELNTSLLEKGIYILRINYENKSKNVKIVKQ